MNAENTQEPQNRNGGIPPLDDGKIIQLAAITAQVIAVLDREMGQKLYDVMITDEHGREKPDQATIPQLLVDTIESNHEMVDMMAELNESIKMLTEAVDQNTDASGVDEDEEEEEPREFKRKRR